MKRRLSSAVVGVATLATSVGIVLAGGVAANAATSPPWETPSDPGSVGTITFYNSAGTQITSGSTTTGPFAAYAVGSAPVRAGDAQAELLEAQPNPNAGTISWNVDTLTGVNAYPVTAGGTPASISNQTNPVVTGSSGDLTLDDFVQEFPNTDPTGIGCVYAATPAGCTNAAYENIYQLRLKTLNGGGTVSPQYDDADIQVTGTTWTQVFPASKTNTSTGLVAAPSPATVGQSVTLTATEAPALAGAVQFMDGATAIGTPVAVNGSGVATKATTTLAQGSHSLSAVFTPTDTTDNNGSTGTATLVVNPAATVTATTLAVNQDNVAGDDVKLTATVAAGATPVNAGTVAFFDNGSTTALTGTASGPTAGVYTLDIPGGLAAGNHSIVAKFTPTDLTAFEASQSAPSTFQQSTAAAAGSPCADGTSVCTDKQYITTSVPVGTLVINTPYTQAAPLVLPAMQLNGAGTEFSTHANFDCIAITDTTAGALPWTASALASPLIKSGVAPPLPANASINSENVGLTGLARLGAGASPLCSGTQSYTGTVGVADNLAADGVASGDTGTAGLGGPIAHTFATGSGGDGTATMYGVLNLNAPSSTAAGTYTGTITFTVAD